MVGQVTRALAVVAAVVVATTLAARPAWAHDELLGTDPADGSVLGAAPPEVVLTFSAPVVELGTQVLVTGPDGAPVGDGPPLVEGSTVRQALAAVRPAGDYRVDWRVTSQDGHPVSGTVAFTASSDAASAPSPDTSSLPPAPQTAPAAGPTAEAAVVAPVPVMTGTPSPSVISPSADEPAAGPSTGQVVAVLAAGAALLVLIRIGRGASLRRRAPTPRADGGTPGGT